MQTTEVRKPVVMIDGKQVRQIFVRWHKNGEVTFVGRIDEPSRKRDNSQNQPATT